MKTFNKFLEEKDDDYWLKESKKWLQKAINSEHRGDCTPLNNPKCTPHRKALAKRFKRGGDLHH